MCSSVLINNYTRLLGAAAKKIECQRSDSPASVREIVEAIVDKERHVLSRVPWQRAFSEETGACLRVAAGVDMKRAT